MTAAFDQPQLSFTTSTSATPEGYHLEPGRCPNVGQACNCPGYCKPELVRDEPIDFDAVSAPISGETKATVELVANDWKADRDWSMFREVCERDAWSNDGAVDPNRVRNRLSNRFGLTIEPRRYSAFWSKAASKGGFLVKDGWTLNSDVKGGNNGKPQRTYRLRT